MLLETQYSAFRMRIQSVGFTRFFFATKMSTLADVVRYACTLSLETDVEKVVAGFVHWMSTNQQMRYAIDTRISKKVVSLLQKEGFHVVQRRYLSRFGICRCIEVFNDDVPTSSLCDYCRRHPERWTKIYVPEKCHRDG